jgi:hypothetical protein
MCHVEYYVPGLGAVGGDSRSVLVGPNGQADAGVIPSQVSDFKIRDCHPWTIQNPLGR